MTNEGYDARTTSSKAPVYYICYKVMDGMKVQDANRYASLESAKHRLKQIHDSSVLEDAEIRDEQGLVVANWAQIKETL